MTLLQDPGALPTPPATVDPFAATGFTGYPACRLGVAGEATTSAREFTAAEAARLARLKSPARRADLAGSLILRRVLIAGLTGCPPGEIDISTEDEGAPVLLRPEGWTISIANKANLTVIALDQAPAEIGVDIELVRPLNWGGMLSMICTADDGAAFEKAFADRPGAHLAFLRMWTLKEAVLKSTRRGFRAGPKAVLVPPDIPTGGGAGELAAFGERFAFWTTQLDNAVISLTRKCDQTGLRKASEIGLAS